MVTAVGAIAAGLLLANPTVSAGAEDTPLADIDETEERSWLGGFQPFVQTGPYTTFQTVKASIDTNFGPRDDPSNVLTNMGWLFEAGLSSPRIRPIPGAPRLQVHGGLLVPTNESSVIGSNVELTEDPATRDDTIELSKASVEFQNSYRAGIGLEFEFSVFETRLKVMPGAQYLHLGARYDSEAESTLTPNNTTRPSVSVETRTQKKLVQHFVGPSLKLSTTDFEVFGLLADLSIEGAFLIDVAGTRRIGFVTDGSSSAAFSWEAAATAGSFNALLRIRLP